jgi:hypothetical protein
MKTKGQRVSKNVEEDYSGRKKSKAYHDSKMAFDREKLFTPQKIKFPYKIEEIAYDSATSVVNEYGNKVRTKNSVGVAKRLKNKDLKNPPMKFKGKFGKTTRIKKGKKS